ncbi:alpha-xylosidase [Actinomadura madurae]|uniref:alpha-D-xyloside xylohydrolase n=2 Tax=Actinomadura madurae TaxID=1993 RepID=A0A1I4ZH87_9ACTN|nr:alpha-xylosidase [Actinomadura madurae]MCP9965945.1 alpha-xylosidase [Actinomadura madurae]URN05460.1 alpha-xylosidase [Actinomadura madurae]SFN49270.1 alpha-D-xyloside xylohydrolase [Actinomadura madurae]SPT49804.1 Alpha-xylosidase [Actinomadura madurae]
MKFSDGYWMMREGVRAFHPVEVLDVDAGPGSFRVYAPVQRIRHRGDLLRGPVVTVTCESPMPDVIGVTLTHFAGERRRGPHFELATDPAGDVSVDDDAATLTSGALSVRVGRGEEWGVDFLVDGRRLTGSAPKAQAVIDTDDGRHYVREQLDLGVDHFVYGLGERFGPLVKNGQSVDVWNADGGTASEQAYKNVPFFLTNAGYGVFVDHPGRVSFEVASEAVARTQFSVEGQSMRYFVIYGPSPKEILRKYTALTGRPARLPDWSFGLWLSTSFTTDYDEETITSFIEGMASRDLPLSVFHFDCFWMREFQWCDFEWDPRVFSDPEGMLRRLRDRGLRTCVWINPYIGQRSPLFEEGRAHGYLLKRPNGDVWQWDKWQPGLAVVDFTNPEAREWYAAKLEALLDMGVDCFKTDFGERIPTDVVYHDGSDPERAHNYYTYLYNQTVFDLLRKKRGESDAVVFARSATTGGQRFPVHWGGDAESTFEAMGESLRGGLSLGMSGFGYWSHDIGGFEGTPDPALFKRWIAFGLLSSHSRLHGSHSYRVPWLFDEESVDVLREFTRLKMRLMPYLAGAARQAYGEGLPMMRAMVVEFPDDPGCTHLERQYMLGEDLLVAPVFSSDGDVSYYVPGGVWTHYLTGERIEGGRWVRERHGFDSVPLLVRPGAVIPVGAVEDRPDYDHADDVTLRVYEPSDGSAVVTQIGDTSFTTTRNGENVRVTGEGAWNVLLVNARVAGVEGGEVADHPLGVLIKATGGELLITLEEEN